MSNPAEEASVECLNQVMSVLKEGKNFLLEAGAGAGKTYTLVEALKFMIAEKEKELISSNGRIACITYTNVAKDEIRSRTDNHPAVLSETIHAFCWSLIKDFQKDLRIFVPGLSDNWKERCDQTGNIGSHKVVYNLGFPKITDSEIYLHHDDVIKSMTKLLADEKFVMILKSRFPVILIDEYQDTNIELAKAMVENLVESDNGPLMGFFGDHWQKIFGSRSVGLITASDGKLTVIGKKANFRSDKLIVYALNRLRPELPQHEKDPESTGQISVFDSEKFDGERRTDRNWRDDLPAEVAHSYLQETIAKLKTKDWSFEQGKTKILMLTNNILAAEQGYSDLMSLFPENDDLLKKNNHYISYLIDVVEPACLAYSKKKYGEMFKCLNIHAPKIRKFEDKQIWSSSLNELMEARDNKTIGDVIEVLKRTKRPRLPEKLLEREARFEELKLKQRENLEDRERRDLDFQNAFREIPYNELKLVEQFIEEKTLFSTQHGVKGAQFENVLIVFGCGWNHYNWNQMLEFMNNGVPEDKRDTFERWRNLFYVACSRPKKRLALLFTQKISEDSKASLGKIFEVNVESLELATVSE